MGTRRIQMRHHVGEHFSLGSRRVDADRAGEFIVGDIIPLVLVSVDVLDCALAPIGVFAPRFDAFETQIPRAIQDKGHHFGAGHPGGDPFNLTPLPRLPMFWSKTRLLPFSR